MGESPMDSSKTANNKHQGPLPHDIWWNSSLAARISSIWTTIAVHVLFLFCFLNFNLGVFKINLKISSVTENGAHPKYFHMIHKY